MTQEIASDGPPYGTGCPVPGVGNIYFVWND